MNEYQYEKGLDGDTRKTESRGRRRKKLAELWVLICVVVVVVGTLLISTKVGGFENVGALIDFIVAQY
jgi:hypothetical protein